MLRAATTRQGRRPSSSGWTASRVTALKLASKARPDGGISAGPSSWSRPSPPHATASPSGSTSISAWRPSPPTATDASRVRTAARRSSSLRTSPARPFAASRRSASAASVSNDFQAAA